MSHVSLYLINENFYACWICLTKHTQLNNKPAFLFNFATFTSYLAKAKIVNLISDCNITKKTVLDYTVVSFRILFRLCLDSFQAHVKRTR